MIELMYCIYAYKCNILWYIIKQKYSDKLYILHVFIY